MVAMNDSSNVSPLFHLKGIRMIGRQLTENEINYVGDHPNRIHASLLSGPGVKITQAINT